MNLINVVGSIVSIYCLINSAVRYEIGKKLQIYIFGLVPILVMFVFTQAISFANPETHVHFTWSNLFIRMWAVYWWIIKIYFAWAIRFSSIKKGKPITEPKVISNGTKRTPKS